MRVIDSASALDKGDAPKKGFNGAPCAYFDGMYQYFKTHAK